MIREFDFIAMLAQRFGTTGEGLRKGIGDDCAHLEFPDSGVQLVTSDMLTHGVHFSDRFMSWCDIGWRSVAVNLSDLAASGADPGRPIQLLLSLAVSSEMEKEQLTDFIDGVDECAARYGAQVAGGDSTWTHGPFTVSVTAMGYADAPVGREGARPGERLCLYGQVGAAGTGLDILETGKRAKENEMLVNAFLRPQPLLQLGYALASTGMATAMIDVSDGVLADAGHLAEQSECDVEIDVRKLTVPDLVLKTLPREAALETAATFGDDYALLCSVPQDRLKEAGELARQHQVVYAVVGGFSHGTGKVRALLDGEPYSVLKSGYQHRLGR